MDKDSTGGSLEDVGADGDDHMVNYRSFALTPQEIKAASRREVSRRDKADATANKLAADEAETTAEKEEEVKEAAPKPTAAVLSAGVVASRTDSVPMVAAAVGLEANANTGMTECQKASREKAKTLLITSSNDGSLEHILNKAAPKSIDTVQSAATRPTTAMTSRQKASCEKAKHLLVTSSKDGSLDRIVNKAAPPKSALKRTEAVAAEAKAIPARTDSAPFAGASSGVEAEAESGRKSAGQLPEMQRQKSLQDAARALSPDLARKHRLLRFAEKADARVKARADAGKAFLKSGAAVLVEAEAAPDKSDLAPINALDVKAKTDVVPAKAAAVRPATASGQALFSLVGSFRSSSIEELAECFSGVPAAELQNFGRDEAVGKLKKDAGLDSLIKSFRSATPEDNEACLFGVPRKELEKVEKVIEIDFLVKSLSSAAPDEIGECLFGVPHKELEKLEKVLEIRCLISCLRNAAPDEIGACLFGVPRNDLEKLEKGMELNALEAASVVEQSRQETECPLAATPQEQYIHCDAAGVGQLRKASHHLTQDRSPTIRALQPQGVLTSPSSLMTHTDDCMAPVFASVEDYDIWSLTVKKDELSIEDALQEAHWHAVAEASRILRCEMAISQAKAEAAQIKIAVSEMRAMIMTESCEAEDELRKAMEIRAESKEIVAHVMAHQLNVAQMEADVAARTSAAHDVARHFTKMQRGIDEAFHLTKKHSIRTKADKVRASHTHEKARMKVEQVGQLWQLAPQIEAEVQLLRCELQQEEIECDKQLDHGERLRKEIKALRNQEPAGKAANDDRDRLLRELRALNSLRLQASKGQAPWSDAKPKFTGSNMDLPEQRRGSSRPASPPPLVRASPELRRVAGSLRGVPVAATETKTAGNLLKSGVGRRPGRGLSSKRLSETSSSSIRQSARSSSSKRLSTRSNPSKKL